jgi:serine/threonine protein kinase/tetratricopeptide (TPR) repeat protein
MEVIFPDSAGLTGAKRIGEGGSGILYAAHHFELGDVAVKVAIDQSPTTSKLLVTEFSLLRSLNHPGIIKLWDFGLTVDRRPYLVMELLPGHSLYDYTDLQSFGNRFQALGWAISALEYLHDLGIVHRDLKGENILLDKRNQARLTDLGLAVGEDDTHAGRSGTVEYMAPEVINNQGASPATDIYSLGVILYRVATGRLPFVSDDPLQVISLKQDLAHIDFDALSLAASPRFAELVRKCLDPEPGNRPKSVAQISEQLGLDGLLGKDDLKPPALSDFFHHYIWSYNTSFAHHETRRFDRDYLIDDHTQGVAANLLEAVGDHFKLHDNEVRRGDSSGFTYRNTSGRTFRVRLLSATSEDATGAELIDYPELDRFAFEATSRKLFTGGIDDEVMELLYRLSTGNLKLLNILLKQMDGQKAIDMQARRVKLTRAQLYYYTPSTEYYQVIGKMIPNVPDELCETAAFLAVDRFGNSRVGLTPNGVVNLNHLQRLAESNWLTADEYLFKRSYYREYLYHQVDDEHRQKWHRQWIKLIENDTNIDNLSRDEQLFHHQVCAGQTEPAIEAALRLADQLGRQQKPNLAANFLALARSLPDAHRNAALFVRLLLASAELARDLGDFNQSLSHYAIAIRQAARHHDLQSLAEAYKNLGDVYKGKHDYDRGHRALGRAVRLYGELGDELELSHCLNNIGNIFWINGDLDEAEVNYQTALEVQRRLNARKDIASSLSNLGTVKCVKQKFEEGIKLFRESILINREIKDYPELARTANNIAVAYNWIDELKAAKEYLQESLEINLATGAEKELLYNYENYYEVEQRHGDYDKMQEWIYKGLRLAKRDDYSHRGIFTVALAELLLIRCKYDKAGHLLAAATKFDHAVTDKMLSMRLAGVCSDHYRLMLDHDGAHAHLITALELADKMGEFRSKANFLVMRSRIERATDAPRSVVEKTFAAVSDILQTLPVKREKLLLLLDRAEYYLSLDQLDEAETVYQQAQSFPHFEGVSSFQSQLCYLGGMIHYQRGSLEKAITLLNDAILSAKTARLRESIWRALVVLGDAHQGQRQYERALKSYIEAFSVLKELAAEISDPRLRKLYLSDRAKIIVAEKLEEMSALAT